MLGGKLTEKVDYVRVLKVGLWLFAGVTVSLVAYLLGMLLKKKFKLAILNPLLDVYKRQI